MHRSDELPRVNSLEEFEQQLRPLWLSAQAGHEGDYRAALALMATRLRRFFLQRLSNHRDEVEDLLQETLLGIHLQRGTYDPHYPVSAWAFAIARHKLVDMWRRRGRKERLNDSIDDFTEDELPYSEDTGPAKRDLHVLLKSLPEAQQQAIVLTKIEGLSIEEASEQTGVSVSALKVQVHRGLKKLADLVRSSE